jgi:hypothetical protein
LVARIAGSSESPPGGATRAALLRAVPRLAPLVALFLVAALGFLLGRVEVRGVALGKIVLAQPPIAILR